MMIITNAPTILVIIVVKIQQTLGAKNNHLLVVMNMITFVLNLMIHVLKLLRLEYVNHKNVKLSSLIIKIGH